jgi:hypothetical protein
VRGPWEDVKSAMVLVQTISYDTLTDNTKTHLGAALLVLSITQPKGVKQNPNFVSGYHPSDQGQRREKKDPGLLI